MKRSVKTLLTALSVALWIAIWWIAAELIGESWILPTPIETLKAFFDISRSGGLWKSIFATFRNILTGYLVGVLFGVGLAALTAKVEVLHIFFSPFLSIIKATPVASVVLILMMLLYRVSGGIDAMPSILTVLIVLPIIWANTEAGFKSKDVGLYEMANCYRFSFLKKIKYLIIPQVYPFFKTAMLTALGLAFKAGVAAEVLGRIKNTIGGNMQFSKENLLTSELIAWTVLVVTGSYTLEKLMEGCFWLYERRKYRK